MGHGKLKEMIISEVYDMMKKILAILAVLCLGIVAMSGINAENNSGLLSYYSNNSQPWVVITNISDSSEMLWTGALAHICNTSIEHSRLIIGLPNYQFNHTEITNITVKIKAQSIVKAGNVSVHYLKHPQSGFYVPHLTNWTFTGYINDWNTPGGDFEQTPLDTLSISQVNQWYYYNITAIKDLVIDSIHGIILVPEFNTNISLYGFGATGAVFEMHYSTGSGKITALEANIWNLEGYSGALPRKASAIFAEIPSCKAIVYKNSTGYYYTYAPTWALLEDYEISYGDGLFILTTADTTWDHT